MQRDWQAIEAHGPVPFYLTWHWVWCWIRTFAPETIRVSARIDGRVVAIGLFTRSLQSRNGLIRARQLRLHQLGDIPMDQIWLEYNDLICEAEHRDAAVDACLEVLRFPEFDWDEIVLPMMTSSRAEHILAGHPGAIVGQRSPSFAVDLAALRAAGQSYLDNLNANSRYQIRRAMRLYRERYGQLQLRQAADRDEALAFFHQAGEYHRMRWPDSGFRNPHFVAFHENLIADAFDDGAIDLLRLSAGDECVAVMYYQLVDRKVYFYLHGLNYSRDGKLKPGLVAHTLATEHYMERGMAAYDYMGGDSQHTKSEDRLDRLIGRQERPRVVAKQKQNEDGQAVDCDDQSGSPYGSGKGLRLRVLRELVGVTLVDIN